MQITYDKLWQLLKREHITKKELGDKTGISSRTMAKLTHGENVTTDILLKICNFLNCSFQDILDITGKSKEPSRPCELSKLNEPVKVNKPVKLIQSNQPSELSQPNEIGESYGESKISDDLREKGSIKKPHDSFTFIDLFSGIGGFHIAMERNGGKCVFASDIDKFAQTTYRTNFPDAPLYGDITSEEVKNKIPQEFDVLCAGFPCQPFSYAGMKAGFEDKTRGTLFFDICNILKKHTPPMVFLENVKGLVSHLGGKTLNTILESLRSLGYYPHFKILSSLDFGLPQKRERWYCVAFREDIEFEFPEPLNTNPTLRDIVDLDDHNPALTLTDFELARIDKHFREAKPGERIKHDNSQYAPNTKKGKYGVYSFQKDDGSLRFHVGDVAKTQIQEAFYACLDTYAPTIIANRTPKLWDLRRKLSVLEAKRLQGFPDDFIMPVSDCQAYKQLGNSVSIPVIQRITEKMLSTFKQIKRDDHE